MTDSSYVLPGLCDMLVGGRGGEGGGGGRGRRAERRNEAKRGSGGEDMRATALEAVIGYLYASGQTERLEHIQRRAMEESL